ncbi:MAG: hypothetical protein ABR599_02110, partial [Gemmatimonadota bacterium]
MKRGLGHAPVLLLLALATGCATASGPQPSAAERRRAAREAALSQQREVIAQQQRADRVAQRLLRALPPPAAGDSVLYLGLRLADAGQSDDHRLMAEALGVPEARRPLVVS